MRLIRKLLLLSFLLFTLGKFSSGQEFIYHAGYFGFFDNHEYFNPYVNDQTIFGSRISGSLGYRFNERNIIMAGTDFLYEFGNKGEVKAPDFIAYYKGINKRFSLTIGAFPRIPEMNLPFALMNDTFLYYRPVVEGILIEYNRNNLHHNIWIDWIQKQSFSQKEAFLIGFSGAMKKNWFVYRHHFIMSHLAHSQNTSIEEHIRDNAGLTVLPGVDFSHHAGLDSLALYAGLLASYDRLRGIYNFRFPVGFYSELIATFKHIGLKGTVYAGEKQIITTGDGFYKSTFYGRADLFYEIKNTSISGKLQTSLHFVPGIMDISMSLVIKANIDGVFKRHQSN